MRQNPAYDDFHSHIGNNASWSVAIELTLDGEAVDGAEDMEWQFNIWRDQDNPDSVDLSLTTVSGNIVVTNTTGKTTIQIDAEPDDLADLEGDYYASLGSETDAWVRTWWLYGKLTFVPGPAWS